MGLAETAELAIKISLTGNARAGVRGLKGDLGGLNQSLGRVGKGVGQIGSGFARAGLVVGGAAITGITLAAKAAIDFEDAFAGVRKTVNEADLTAAGLSFESLARSFRDMATEIPIAATEFAQIGETAGALGIKAGDIEEFTKTVALLGVTTNLSTEAAGEALGKLGTILSLSGDDFTEFADALVNLGNKGASTEAEIIETAKRFAGVGRQAGLTKEEILALSSAITSLGAEPEAGGSALSRIFSNMGTEIANATKKGQAFATLTGDSLKELAARINSGDSLGIFRDTIAGLNKLKTTTEKYQFLKALGITNVRDRDAIIKIANDTTVLDEALQNAKDSTGALGAEAQKRFDTVAQKLKLLKNNAIEAAITFGEGLTPAIGRAAAKLSAFLKDPSNKGEIQALGASLGETIDNIDWTKVLEGAKTFLSVMKSALDFALLLVGAIDKLPAEIKAAGVGFLALNKLSGGLLASGAGNILGGLGGAALTGLAARAPGVGRLFAQPVFVTNWAMMGGVGGGALPGGGGALGTVLKLLPWVAFGALIAEGFISANQDPETRKRTYGTNDRVGITTVATADKPGFRLPPRQPSNTVQRVALSERVESILASQARSMDALEANRLELVTKAKATTAAVREAKIAQVAATRTGDSAIVRAIYANRPIISVNVSNRTVTTTYASGTTIRRTASTGSYNAGLSG